MTKELTTCVTYDDGITSGLRGTGRENWERSCTWEEGRAEGKEFHDLALVLMILL